MVDAVKSPQRKRSRQVDSPARSDTREGLLEFDHDMISIGRHTPKSPRPALAPREPNFSNAPAASKSNFGVLESKRIISEKDSLIFQLRLQVDELKRALDKVPHGTREAMQTTERLQSQLETTRSTIRDQNEYIEELKDDLADFQNAEIDIQKIEIAYEELQDRLEETTEKLKKRDHEIENLNIEIDTLRTANTQNAKLAASRPTADDAKVRAQLVEALGKATHFQTDIVRLRNERQELFNELTEERETAKAEQAKLREEINDLTANIEKQRLEILAAQQETDAAKSASKALEEAHARINETEHDRYEKLEADYKEKTEELKASRAEMSQRILDLQSQVTSLESQILSEKRTAQAAESTRDATLLQLKPELARAQSRVRELELQIELLKDQSQNQLDQTQQQAEERASSRASKYETQLEQLQTELETSRNEAKSLANNIKRLEFAARERYVAHTDETKKLKSQVADEYEKRNAAEAELERLRLEVETLKRSQRTLSDRQRELEQETSELQVINRRAINDAKAIEADKLRLQLKLESLEGRPLSASERATFEETKLAYEVYKSESIRQRNEWERTYKAMQEEIKVAQTKISGLQEQVDIYSANDQKRLQEQSWRIEASLKETWDREQARLVAEINNMSKELSSARQLHLEVVRQLEEAQQQVVLRQTAITEHELQQTRLRNQLHELDQTIVVRDNEVRSLREQMAHYTAKISSLQTLVSEATAKTQAAELRAEQIDLARQEAVRRLDETVTEATARMDRLQLDSTRKVASAVETGAATAESQFAKQADELKSRYERRLSAQKRKLLQAAEDNETQLIKEMVKVQRAFDCTLNYSTELEQEQAQTNGDLIFMKEFASYSDKKATAYSPVPRRRTFAGLAAFVHAAVRMQRYGRTRVSNETEKNYRDMLRKHSLR